MVDPNNYNHYVQSHGTTSTVTTPSPDQHQINENVQRQIQLLHEMIFKLCDGEHVLMNGFEVWYINIIDTYDEPIERIGPFLYQSTAESVVSKLRLKSPHYWYEKDLVPDLSALHDLFR